MPPWLEGLKSPFASRLALFRRIGAVGQLAAVLGQLDVFLRLLYIARVT